MQATLLGRLKKWFSKHEQVEPKEKKMITLIKFDHNGFKPTLNSDRTAFNLRSPIPINLPPNTEMKLDLELSCNYPLQVFEAAFRAEKRVEVNVPGAVDANRNISVTILNKTGSQLLLEAGDTICRAVPLFVPAFSYED